MKLLSCLAIGILISGHSQADAGARTVTGAWCIAAADREAVFKLWSDGASVPDAVVKVNSTAGREVCLFGSLNFEEVKTIKLMTESNTIFELMEVKVVDAFDGFGNPISATDARAVYGVKVLVGDEDA